MAVRLWTQPETERLKAMFAVRQRAKKPIAAIVLAIGAALGRPAEDIRVKVLALRATGDLPDGKEVTAAPRARLRITEEEWSADDLTAQDARFQRAMRVAIEIGAERP